MIDGRIGISHERQGPKRGAYCHLKKNMEFRSGSKRVDDAAGFQSLAVFNNGPILVQEEADSLGRVRAWHDQHQSLRCA